MTVNVVGYHLELKKKFRAVLLGILNKIVLLLPASVHRVGGRYNAL